jgi:hypothetical protein
MRVVPNTNILMFGSCFETHTYCQAKRESSQRAICLRCLADVVFSYMAAVETKQTTCRLTIIVGIFSFKSKQLALSQMRGDGLLDIAIVRRRHAAVAAAFIYTISTGRGNPRRMRFAKRRWIFSEHIIGLSDGQFRRMYRLSKVAFQQLVTVIREHRQRAGRRPGRHAVEANLSMALRWLAGGSYLDIALAHCVSVSTFFHVFDETICDIDDTITLVFRHENEEYLKRLARGLLAEGVQYMAVLER